MAIIQPFHEIAEALLGGYSARQPKILLASRNRQSVRYIPLTSRQIYGWTADLLSDPVDTHVALLADSQRPSIRRFAMQRQQVGTDYVEHMREIAGLLVVAFRLLMQSKQVTQYHFKPSVLSRKFLYMMVERFAVAETGTSFPLAREAVRDSSLRSRCSLRQNDRPDIRFVKLSTGHDTSCYAVKIKLGATLFGVYWSELGNCRRT